MSEVVLDASALLALLNQESGAEAVAGAIPGALVSTVNLSEVVAKLAERGMPEAAIREALGGLGLDVASFDEDAAYAAGILRPSTREKGLSLGDRACIGLGMARSMPVLTADKLWQELELNVEIRVIR